MQLAARLAEEAKWSDPETLIGVAFVAGLLALAGLITWLKHR